MFTHRKQGILECTLCSHNCRIAEGKFGFCRVRQNINGSLTLPFYGRISGMSSDPVEKKPLYHYHPGTYVLSVGYWGCNFRCPFCQNWNISQELPDEYSSSISWTPETFTSELIERNCTTVCHTYSEPEIHFEFVYDTVLQCRNNHIGSILVTNGSLQDTPAEMLYKEIEAVNIDLKAYDRDYYKRILRGDLDTVLRNIDIASALTHTEVTMLIVPGVNDDKTSISNASQFIANLEKKHKRTIPLHLSRYFPQYRSGTAATPLRTMHTAKKIASVYLEYVYLGNVGEASDTICPECSTVCIGRSGYNITTNYTVENEKASCPKCGYSIPLQL